MSKAVTLEAIKKSGYKLSPTAFRNANRCGVCGNKLVATTSIDPNQIPRWCNYCEDYWDTLTPEEYKEVIKDVVSIPRG